MMSTLSPRWLLYFAWVLSATSSVSVGSETTGSLSAESAPRVLMNPQFVDGAVGVGIDAPIVLQLRPEVDTAAIDVSAVTLLGPHGPETVNLQAEHVTNRLVITPQRDLEPASRYTLFLSDTHATRELEPPLQTLSFTTASLVESAKPESTDTEMETSAAPTRVDDVAANPRQLSAGTPEIIARLHTGCESHQSVRGYRFCHDPGSVKDGVFTPGFGNTNGRWRVNAKLPNVLTAQEIAPGELSAGMTAVIGTILRIDDQPLAGVTVSVGQVTARSDTSGRFILRNPPVGHQVVLIDGRTANHADEEYGQFLVSIEVQSATVNALPYHLFMPRITARDKVHIGSPLAVDTVVTHPDIPGLELHIPAGTVFRDREGKVITEVALVPMPVDRSPVPAPGNFQVYFSMQPGGATVQQLSGTKSAGLQFVYPNYGEQVEPHPWFFYYDAEHTGWTAYGEGQVSDDETVVKPAVGWGTVTLMPAGGANVGGVSTHPPACHPDKRGDPIDCASGAFTDTSTDLAVNDLETVAFTRSYVSNDTATRSFGRGSMNAFEMFLYAPGQTCGDLRSNIGTEVDLVTSGGGVYAFTIPTGKTFFQTTGVHTATSSRFYGATLSVTEQASTVELADGTLYRFQRYCPTILLSTTDRFGNVTQINTNAGLINEVTLPGGRSVSYGYNANNQISSLTDNSGRGVSYAYNTAKQLTTVTYPDGTTEQYAYDTNGNMLTVKDRRGNTMVTNEYDANQRVKKQTFADSSTYQFAYTLGGTSVVATDVTDTRGNVEHMTFDASGYPLTRVRASNTSSAQTTTYVRGQNELVTSTTDPLGRVTAKSYDAFGNVLTETFLSGTANAVTYTYTYTPDFHQLASIKDPLGHSTTFSYTGRCLNSVQDALGHATTIVCGANGKPSSIQDAVGHTTSFTYQGVDLHTVTDALNRTTTYSTDELGRVLSVTDPLGRSMQSSYDSNDRVTTATDPMNQTTNYTYDGNGNLTDVTDPNGGHTHYGYDARNRRTSRSDALIKGESWTYDGEGNPLTYTDRKNQLTQYQYDPLNRLSLTTFADASTVTPSFDAGNRLTALVDTVSGTINHSYDGLDRLTQEQTPQGIVTYTYDAASRRATMTPASQTQIVYTFDNADRLTNIVQGTQGVTIGYDNANRRSTLTLPNGVVTTYGYDNADELTSFTYKTSTGTTLSSMAYTYDATGQRLTHTGGFGTELQPTATTGTNTFDLNNKQTLWNGYSLSYDMNGDPTSNASSVPSTTYAFDPRHRLTNIVQGGTTNATFAYDALGRRTSKTIGGTTTSFLYDGSNAVQETQGATTSAILSGLGIDERYARAEAAGTRYFLTDALGSTVALTDSSQAVQEMYSYEPFGEVTATGSSDNSYQYTGRENDGTGLYYYRARYYSPSLKRFISEDPMGLAAGLNTYSYVLDNPLALTDPFGLDVDLNLFPPGSDAYNGAHSYPGDPNECTIAGHGSPLELAGLSPRELAKKIAETASCFNKPIRLLSCNTGLTPEKSPGTNIQPKPYGWNLHKATGQPVWAPDTWGWLHDNGSTSYYTIGPTKHHLPPSAGETAAFQDRTECTCGGNWVQFN